MDTSQAITIASVVARAGLKNLSDFTFCSFGNLVLLVLAFFDSSLLSCHFSPFTGVLRKIFGSLTREVWKSFLSLCNFLFLFLLRLDCLDYLQSSSAWNYEPSW